MILDLEAIPAVREAIESEQFTRDLAFSGLHERLAGIPVLPLTFRHWQWLMIIKSPFLTGGDLEPKTIRGHIGAYFWTVAPMRPQNPQNTWRERWQKRRFLQRVGRLDTLTALEAIRDHLLDAFQDAPAVTQSQESRASYFGSGAVIVHRIATQYGWDDDAILDKSIKRLFQYLKLIDRELAAKAGKQSINFNPSDAIKGRMAAKIAAEPDCEEAKIARIDLN